MPIDASIPLQGRPVQFPSMTEGYGQMLTLRNAVQQSALNAERLRAAQMANKERKQDMRDRETAQSVLEEMGGSVEKALPKLAGKVSFKMYSALQDAHVKRREAIAKVSKDEFEVKKNQDQQLLALTRQAEALSDDQYLQQWPTIRAAATKIKPDLELPEQAIPKANLGAFRIGLMTEEQYNAAEDQRRKQAQEKRDAELHPLKRDKAIAERDETERKDSVARLAAAAEQGESAYLDQLERTPLSVARLVPEKWTKEVAASIRTIGMTPAEQATQAGAQASRSETARHNLEMESIRRGAEGRAANAQTTMFERELRDLQKREADLHESRRRIGALIGSAEIDESGAVTRLGYLDQRGNPVTLTDAGQIQDGLRDLKSRYTSATDELKQIIRDKYKVIQRAGGQTSVPLDKALAEIDASGVPAVRKPGQKAQPAAPQKQAKPAAPPASTPATTPLAAVGPANAPAPVPAETPSSGIPLSQAGPSAVAQETATPAATRKKLSVAEIKKKITAAAEKHGVDPALAIAVAQHESRFDQNATGKNKDGGLFQILPGTAEDLGITDVYDPDQNIDGGVRYLKELLDRYQGDTQYALMAYNGGPGNVDRGTVSAAAEAYPGKVLALMDKSGKAGSMVYRTGDKTDVMGPARAGEPSRGVPLRNASARTPARRPEPPKPAPASAAPKKWNVKGVTYTEGQEITARGKRFKVTGVENGKIKAVPVP